MSEPAQTVDAVVIGAGPNGLVAANLLADAGWQVLVVEAADRPGGALRTDEFVPGFRADRYGGFYPMAALSPVITGLDLAGYGLHWRHAPTALAHLLPDDRCALICRDVDVTAASLAAFAPADGEAWRADFAAWRRARTDVTDLLFRPRRSTRADRLPRPGRFAGDGARRLLTDEIAHLAPDGVGGGPAGWLLAMTAQDVGLPVPEGGAARLARALADRLAARSCRIACGRAVTRVLVAAGTAVGVELAGGRLVRARRAVLAAVPATTLYRHLVAADQVPARLLADLPEPPATHGTVRVDWALNGPIPWRNRAVRGAGAVRLSIEPDGSGDPMVLGQMTTTDPTRSPAGTESAWAAVRVAADRAWTEDDLAAVADRVEAAVERHAPGLRALIRGRRVLGPAELGEPGPVRQERADTPIDRLFLAGTCVQPGVAVHGGPAARAVRAALARASVAGLGYRALVRRAHT
jgi:phytoene dehydrogenase-like protein